MHGRGGAALPVPHPNSSRVTQRFPTSKTEKGHPGNAGSRSGAGKEMRLPRGNTWQRRFRAERAERASRGSGRAASAAPGEVGALRSARTCPSLRASGTKKSRAAGKRSERQRATYMSGAPFLAVIFLLASAIWYVLFSVSFCCMLFFGVTVCYPLGCAGSRVLAIPVLLHGCHAVLYGGTYPITCR